MLSIIFEGFLNICSQFDFFCLSLDLNIVIKKVMDMGLITREHKLIYHDHTSHVEFLHAVQYTKKYLRVIVVVNIIFLLSLLLHFTLMNQF